MGKAKTFGTMASEPSDGIVEISKAGQLVKVTQSTDASMGSAEGRTVTVIA